jgi:hypothetical protein
MPATVATIVGPNAHAVAVDPDPVHVYLPIANLGCAPVLHAVSVTRASGGEDEQESIGPDMR